jgi:hypothetical protein
VATHGDSTSFRTEVVTLRLAPVRPSRSNYVLQKSPYTFISSPLGSLNLKSKSLRPSPAGPGRPRSYLAVRRRPTRLLSSQLGIQPPRPGDLSASTRSRCLNQEFHLRQQHPAAGSSTSIPRSAPPPPRPAAAPASSHALAPLLHGQVRVAAGKGRPAPAHAFLLAALLPVRSTPACSLHAGLLAAPRTCIQLLLLNCQQKSNSAQAASEPRRAPRVAPSVTELAVVD